MINVRPAPNRLILRPVALAVALFAAGQAGAQTVSLPEVVVTGQTDDYNVRNSSAATRTITPIEQVPQSVVVIPRAIIEDQGSQTLSEALRNVSNVTAIDQRDSNLTTFKVRGFSSATVLDGVPMPGAFPNQQSLSGVEQLTVIKGPAGGAVWRLAGHELPNPGWCHRHHHCGTGENVGPPSGPESGQLRPKRIVL